MSEALELALIGLCIAMAAGYLLWRCVRAWRVQRGSAAPKSASKRTTLTIGGKSFR